MRQHHSPLQTQDSTDKQLFNYLCIRIPIDTLKKALSPWQQTSYSLYLSVCLPTKCHPHGTGQGGKEKKRGGEGRGGNIFPSISCLNHPYLLHLLFSIPLPTLSFCEVTLILWSYHFLHHIYHPINPPTFPANLLPLHSPLFDLLVSVLLLPIHHSTFIQPL